MLDYAEMLEEVIFNNFCNSLFINVTIATETRLSAQNDTSQEEVFNQSWKAKS